MPKNRSTSNVNELFDEYQKRLDYEKYMNPKGIKPTITSRFKKESTEIDFLNHEILLMRSQKPYEKN